MGRGEVEREVSSYLLSILHNSRDWVLFVKEWFVLIQPHLHCPPEIPGVTGVCVCVCVCV